MYNRKKEQKLYNNIYNKKESHTTNNKSLSSAWINETNIYIYKQKYTFIVHIYTTCQMVHVKFFNNTKSSDVKHQ